MNYSTNYATSKSLVSGNFVNPTLFISLNKISRRPIYVPIVPLPEPISKVFSDSDTLAKDEQFFIEAFEELESIERGEFLTYEEVFGEPQPGL